MAVENIVICSWDEWNIGGEADELNVRLIKPLRLGPNSRISLEKLILTNAEKGHVWVTIDAAVPVVMTRGGLEQLLGVYHCEGVRNRTYSFFTSSLSLPLRSHSLSTISVRLIDPITNSPIKFHKDPRSLIHLQVTDVI